jgi:subtilisin family serine protease
MFQAERYEADVIVWSAQDPGTQAQVESDYGLRQVGTVGEYCVCQITSGGDPEQLSQDLLLDPRVRWAQPNYSVETAEARGRSWAFDDGHPDCSGYSDQSAARRLGLDAAHRISTGKDVVVAILDTGVDPEHPLLAGRLLTGCNLLDGSADVTEAPDGIDSNGNRLVDESLGHGTHVAGIVSLVAPGARILPIKVLDNDGHGSGVVIARGIDFAVERGARVVNLSLGMLNQDLLVKGAVTRATERGVVVVAAAGNWGAESPKEYPAAFSNPLAIAATGINDKPAPFTSFGDFVDLCAPGDKIRSAYWNGNTAVWSGTSMSAPFVSGTAALLLSLHPEWGLSEVRDRLSRTAASFDRGVHAPYKYGAGRLDVAAALAADAAYAGSGGGARARSAD